MKKFYCYDIIIVIIATTVFLSKIKIFSTITIIL